MKKRNRHRKYEGAIVHDFRPTQLATARVSLDQSVRLQEGSERLSKWLVGLTVILIALTVVLAWPIFKHA